MSALSTMSYVAIPMTYTAEAAEAPMVSCYVRPTSAIIARNALARRRLIRKLKNAGEVVPPKRGPFFSTTLFVSQCCPELLPLAYRLDAVRLAQHVEQAALGY